MLAPLPLPGARALPPGLRPRGHVAIHRARHSHTLVSWCLGGRRVAAARRTLCSLGRDPLLTSGDACSYRADGLRQPEVSLATWAIPSRAARAPKDSKGERDARHDSHYLV